MVGFIYEAVRYGLSRGVSQYQRKQVGSVPRLKPLVQKKKCGRTNR